VHECPALAAPKEEQYERRYEESNAAARDAVPKKRCLLIQRECHVRNTQKNGEK
jgi:hypothetical protein